MRKLLNTLYVTTPEAYLSKDGLPLLDFSILNVVPKMSLQNQKTPVL